MEKLTTIKGTLIKKIEPIKSSGYQKQLEQLKKVQNKTNRKTSNIEKVKIEKIKKQNFVKYEYIQPKKQVQEIKFNNPMLEINDAYESYMIERCTSKKEKIKYRCTRCLNW